ncbi:MAG TPA: bifunctional riboflavin kinase/FMN adenylyltransferase, partial [Marmoricola sp.]|nr:bifunctional riboflavin kinase/FMN adenylyltransferase [Marmoricola sp.]
MAVWSSLDDFPENLGPTVVSIGNFDGVHLGHQHVIRTAAQAADGKYPVVAVTFDPHPMAVLRPEHAPAQLTSISQRAELLEQAGADHLLAIPFSREIAAWTPDQFIQWVLIDTLHATTVVVGANFRFGARAAGDSHTLAAAGQKLGFEVISIDLDGGPQVWSSTYIRACLGEGDVEGAAEALGRPYSVSGVVSRGDQRGRELGFPTANVPIGAVIAPADGVYAGWLKVSGERHPAPQSGDWHRHGALRAAGVAGRSLALRPVPVDLAQRLEQPHRPALHGLSGSADRTGAGLDADRGVLHPGSLHQRPARARRRSSG